MEQIKIGFVGYDNVDAAMYLARVLAADGDVKVAVVDFTKTHELLNAGGLPKHAKEIVGYYKDILLLDGAQDNSKDLAVQQFVLFYVGEEYESQLLGTCNHVVYSTNMVPNNACKLSKVKISENAVKYFVVRNFASFKYGEAYLSSLTEEKFEDIHTYAIPYDERDYKSRCYLGIDKKQKLTALSLPVKYMILDLYSTILGKVLSRKEKAALLRRA